MQHCSDGFLKAIVTHSFISIVPSCRHHAIFLGETLYLPHSNCTHGSLGLLDYCIFPHNPKRTSFDWSSYHHGLDHGKNVFSPVTNRTRIHLEPNRAHSILVDKVLLVCCAPECEWVFIPAKMTRTIVKVHLVQTEQGRGTKAPLDSNS